MRCVKADRRKLSSAFLLAAFLTGTASPLLAQSASEVEIDRSAIEHLAPAPHPAASQPARRHTDAKAARKAASGKETTGKKPQPGKAASPPLQPLSAIPAPPAEPVRQAPPPAPARPVPPLPPEIGPAHRILFPPEAAELPENAKPELNEVARQLTADAHLFAELCAYAGAPIRSGAEEKSASETRRLSLFRALATRAYLTAQGVSPKQVDVRPLGNRPLPDRPEPPDRVDVVLRHR